MVEHKTKRKTKMETVIILQETRSLGLFRSDYMVHSLESNNIKQVEFNTIASSFAGISSDFQPLHRYKNTSSSYYQPTKPDQTKFIYIFSPLFLSFIFYLCFNLSFCQMLTTLCECQRKKKHLQNIP